MLWIANSSQEGKIIWHVPVKNRLTHLWTYFWTDNAANCESIVFRINFIGLQPF